MTTIQLVAIAAAVLSAPVLIVRLLWLWETPSMRAERKMRGEAKASPICQHVNAGWTAGHLTCLDCQAPLYETATPSPTPTHGLMTPHHGKPPSTSPQEV